MLFVSLFILLLKTGHVVGDVNAKDVFAVNIGIQFLAFVIISWEPLLGVGNVHASVNSSLQCSKYLKARKYVSNGEIKFLNHQTFLQISQAH